MCSGRRAAPARQQAARRSGGARGEAHAARFGLPSLARPLFGGSGHYARAMAINGGVDHSGVSAGDGRADDAARVAIVGAGPSGIFLAQVLRAQQRVPLTVDVYDRMPSPYGLLRYGVAPDHTSIKSVANALAKVFNDEGIAFHGLVEFGADVTRDELLASYDAVVYAAGASEELRLNIPGESLPGNNSARDFVAWYSGHPDAKEVDLRGVKSVAAVGVGNVAVDVARVLAKDAADLEWTDMPRRVLDALGRHTVGDVWVIGRRGPHHVSFTTRELRELCELEDVNVSVSAGAFDDIDDADLDRRTRNNIATLKAAAEREVAEVRARLHFLFWRRPVEVKGDGRVEQLVLEETKLDESGRVVGTGRLSTLDVQLVLRAIGYRGAPLADVPFDTDRGTVPNDGGRVTTEDGHVLPREYVVGWIKRGPIGVIGTNKSDAAATAAHIVDDLVQAREQHGPQGYFSSTPRFDLVHLMASRGFRPSTFADWQRIDEAEMAKGSDSGRSRAKVEEWRELIDIARSSRPGGPPTPADVRRDGGDPEAEEAQEGTLLT